MIQQTIEELISHLAIDRSRIQRVSQPFCWQVKTKEVTELARWLAALGLMERLQEEMRKQSEQINTDYPPLWFSNVFVGRLKERQVLLLVVGLWTDQENEEGQRGILAICQKADWKAIKDQLRREVLYELSEDIQQWCLKHSRPLPARLPIDAQSDAKNNYSLD